MYDIEFPEIYIIAMEKDIVVWRIEKSNDSLLLKADHSKILDHNVTFLTV